MLCYFVISAVAEEEEEAVEEFSEWWVGKVHEIHPEVTC